MRMRLQHVAPAASVAPAADADGSNPQSMTQRDQHIRSGTSEALPCYRQLTAYKVSNVGGAPTASVRSTTPLTTSVGTTLTACAAVVSAQLTVLSSVAGIVTLHVRAVEEPFLLNVNAYWSPPPPEFRTRTVMYSLSKVQLVGISVWTKSLLPLLLRPSDVMDERGTSESGQKAMVGPGSLKRP